MNEREKKLWVDNVDGWYQQGLLASFIRSENEIILANLKVENGFAFHFTRDLLPVDDVGVNLSVKEIKKKEVDKGFGLGDLDFYQLIILDWTNLSVYGKVVIDQIRKNSLNQQSKIGS